MVGECGECGLSRRVWVVKGVVIVVGGIGGYKSGKVGVVVDIEYGRVIV